MVATRCWLIVLSLCAATVCAGAGRQSLRGAGVVGSGVEGGESAVTAGNQFNCTSTVGSAQCQNLHRVCCPDPSGEGDALCAPKGTQCMQLALG